MIKEFRDFIAKGNVMDLAVGLIIGAAFTAIVKSMVSDLINPVIGLFLVVLILLIYSSCWKERQLLFRWQRRAMQVQQCLPMGPFWWLWWIFWLLLASSLYWFAISTGLKTRRKSKRKTQLWLRPLAPQSWACWPRYGMRWQKVKALTNLWHSAPSVLCWLVAQWLVKVNFWLAIWAKCLASSMISAAWTRPWWFSDIDTEVIWGDRRARARLKKKKLTRLLLSNQMLYESIEN